MSKSVLWSSCTKLSCSNAQSPTVIICIVVPEILATIECPEGETPYQPTTLTATLTKVWKDGSACGTGLWRYLFSYDENLLTDPTSTLKADDIEGAFCEGCITSWVEDIINRTLCEKGLL